MLDRVIVPSRLALIYRGGETLGYNPAINSWERLDEDTAEVLRWLRAGRERSDLKAHLNRRFGYSSAAAMSRIQEILVWCIFRRLLYLDQEPTPPEVINHANPLETVYWICTQACNLRCTYCYQDATVSRPNELSTDEGKDLVDQVVEAGAQTFIFTGGEPFTRRDLLEVASYSRSRGLRTNAITNGHYITRNNIKDVAEIFDTVTISLDHGVPEHHDTNRGKGSWLRAVNGIDLLLEAGVSVDVNSVLSRFGLKDVKELLKFARKRPIGQLRIIPQFPMGRAASARADELPPAEVMGLNDQLHQASCDLEEGEARVSPEGTYSSKRIIRNHCGAGLSEVSVDPEGWVYPCKLLQYEKFKTHNVRNQRLIDIFNQHPVLRQLRGNVANTMHPCKTCIIKNHCGGGCRGIHFSFTQEYIEAHPLFCAYLRSTFEVQAWASSGGVPSRRKSDFQQHRKDQEGYTRRIELPVLPASVISVSGSEVNHEKDKQEPAGDLR
ncbi:MAG TPA: radical SAM protein [Blastocatellia bacterium]|nr:radical SAM protein [Blastocatellia bacterium]